MFRRFLRVKPSWHQFIDRSFLTQDLRQAYHELLNRKFEQLELR